MPIPYVQAQKAKQTNRVPGKNGTSLSSVQELMDWVKGVDPDRYWAEIKYDGYRSQAQREGWWTTKPRWIEARAFDHICQWIPEGCVLDGEIVPVDGEGHEVVAHYMAASPKKLKFVAFDVLYIGGKSVMDAPQRTRRDLLVDLICSSQMMKSPIEIVRRRSDFPRLLQEMIDTGREGLVLKDMHAPYKPGSRSAWLKCKITETVDVVITDCDSKPTEWRVKPGETGKDGVFYPEGRHSDPWLAGHVGLSYGFFNPKTGNLVPVGSLGVTGPRAEMEKHIGKVAEVASFGPQFPTGAIRHPSFLRWRDDKSAVDCVFIPGQGESHEDELDLLSALLAD
jgi:ATP-dependent DNA ligase